MTGKSENSRSSEPSPVDAFDEDLRATVRKGLDHLLPMMAPEVAEVFRRAELLGQPCETIAAALGLSVGTVESRLRAARIEMRRLLALSAQSCLDCSPHRES
jgi:DNA-directed RNA polymerase specialized sigma24 family protein